MLNTNFIRVQITAKTLIPHIYKAMIIKRKKIVIIFTRVKKLLIKGYHFLHTEDGLISLEDKSTLLFYS